jgi:hypothetical protein
MKLPPCERCRGQVFLEEDEYVCLQCGCRPTGYSFAHESDQRLMKAPSQSRPSTGSGHFVQHWGVMPRIG